METGQKAHERPTFPVTLVLVGRRCIVVGGGRLAENKVEGLLAAGAEVDVIAPRLSAWLRDLVRAGAITHVPRNAQPEDLDGATLIFVAHDDYSFDPALVDAARRQGRLINVVDVTKACDLYMPAVVRRGPVSVAVSTGGRSPLLAARLRELVERFVGPEYGQLAEILGDLREEMKARCPDPARRAELWRDILDSGVLTLLREERLEEAAAHARAFLPQPAEEVA